MILLSIDPGIERVGFAMLSYENQKIIPLTYGIITTSKDLPKSKRILQIFEDLSSLIKKYKPSHFVMEDLFFSKNVKTALTIAEVRGSFYLLAELYHLEIEEIKPNEVKKYLTGNGKADKSQIQQAVTLFLNLKQIPQPDDVADALAIGICSIHS